MLIVQLLEELLEYGPARRLGVWQTHMKIDTRLTVGSCSELDGQLDQVGLHVWQQATFATAEPVRNMITAHDTVLL